MVSTRLIEQEVGRLTQLRMSFMELSVALYGDWLWRGSSMLVTKDMAVSLFDNKIYIITQVILAF